VLGHVIETDERFEVVEVVEQRPGEIRAVVAAWDKVSFDAWWGGRLGARRAPLSSGTFPYTLPRIVGSPAPAGAWEALSSFGRVGHTAVWTGTEMIVWGGTPDLGFTGLASGGRYNPTTDAWTPTSTGTGLPTARYLHTAVWTGSEMVVWGGTDGLDVLDNGGRYNPVANAWTATSIAAGVPAARYRHTAVWTGTRMVVWGGTTFDGVSESFLNSGGRYDPAGDTWTATSTGSGVPSARDSHAAVWTGSVMIVWGGFDGVSDLQTGGRYDPASDAWTATSVGSGVPTGRSFHTAVWTGSVMIVWGGFDGVSNSDLNSGGRYDPAANTWAATSLGAGVPSARTFHTAVWTGSAMVVWGGDDGTTALSSGGRYDPSANAWAPTSEAVGVPSGRFGHTAVWTGTEMAVWGGATLVAALSDGGRFDPAANSWSTIASVEVAPAARAFHSAVWTGAEMLVWGGVADVDVRLNDGARYAPALDAWTPTSTGAGVPEARDLHTAVWTGTEMVVWGGRGAASFLNSGGRYNPVTDSWAPTSVAAAVPTARYLHTAVWSGSAMIVWGGFNGVADENGGGRYDPAANAWTATSVTGAVPPARSFHTAVWTGTEMVVWGGDDGLAFLNDGGRYDPAANLWASLPIAGGTPTGRVGHQAVWSGSEMIVWGGFDATGYVSSGGRFDPQSNAWVATSQAAGVPTPREAHTAVWTGTAMIVWGGGDDSVVLDDGASYDPAADAWTPMSADLGVPSPREFHTAVWTGSSMIVWGGAGALLLSDGGIFSPIAPPRLGNVSTRGFVGTADQQMIGGFIVSGNVPKTVLVRALGPTLGGLGVSGALADPVLILTTSQGAVLGTNNDWQVGRTPQEIADIQATGLAPPDDLEPAILITLPPGAYTAIVSGSGGGTGVGLIEAYAVDADPDAWLSNVSTRGFVGTGDGQQIGGFIIDGTEPKTVLVRSLGPTLGGLGVSGALANPVLALTTSGGTILDTNDDWQAGRTPQEIAAIQATGLAPPDGLEPAILITLPPGAYTAIVSGAADGTGVGLVEVYEVAAAP
jgi:hypothetical protein